MYLNECSTSAFLLHLAYEIINKEAEAFDFAMGLLLIRSSNWKKKNAAPFYISTAPVTNKSDTSR